MSIKKTVIANWGIAKQGKSTTIKRLTQLILLNYPHAITSITQIDYSKDIKLIISIGSAVIGIESTGDPDSRLKSSIDEFVLLGCNIIICATRTSGQTVNDVSDLNKLGYEIIWVTNYRSYEKPTDTLNDLSAQHLFILLNDIIKGNL